MPAPPNILLITSDQQHYSTLGCSNPRIQTPHLDRLATEGTRFTRAYCNNPLCSPSRSTLITGMYPCWHHCWTLGTKLPEETPTLGGFLHAGGYATTLVGKAHFQPAATQPDQTSLEYMPKLRDLDFWRAFHGPWYGFDRVEVARMHADEYFAGSHYAIWMEDQGLANWQEYFWPWPYDPDYPKGEHHWKLPQEYHYTTWTAERTIANIEASVDAQQPFFVWASFHDPHPPYLAPAPWSSRYAAADMQPGNLAGDELAHMPPHFGKTQEEQPDFSAYQETPFANHGFHSHRYPREKLQADMAVYYGMISFMDQQIGRILDTLDRLDIADNTLVVFTSDHGHFLGQHGLIAKGAFHYEDLLRLPFLVRWPGQIPAGGKSQALTALIDLAPTFLAAAGLPVPGHMQGISQLDVWRGRTAAVRDEVIVENRHQPTALHLRTYIDEQFKLTIYRGQTYGELFDLHADPEERCNRWDDPAYATIKQAVMQRFLNAELKREPTRFQRIASA